MTNHPTPTASNGNGHSHATRQNVDLLIAEQACRRILVKLQLISDGPAAQFRDGPKPPHYSDSKVPEGVRLGGTTSTLGAPSKLTSLWGHYSWRVERAQAKGDAGELLKLAACATRDYEVHMRMRPAFYENHEHAVTELLRDCRGMSDVDASWWTGAPVKWVRRQRVLAGYDPDLGETRRNDPRLEKALDLKAQGFSQTDIAAELGISQQRVSQLLSGTTSKH